MGTHDRRLTRADAVSVGMIVVCIAVGVDAGLRLWNQPLWRGRLSSAPTPAAAVATPEQTLFRNLDIDYRSSARTLVLLVDSSCGYCSQSMPFYRRLVEAPGRRAGKPVVRLVAVSTEPREVLSAYLGANGVQADTLISLSRGALPVQRTPTLLLVNAQGQMERSWVGRLTKDDENAVLALMHTGSEQ